MSFSLAEKQLGQGTPADTNAASIYSPGDDTTGVIKEIFVCNTSASNRTFRIFVDDDGTTYSTATALYYDVAISANTTTQISTFIGMDNSAGNFAIRTSAANDLTFTIFGYEVRRKLNA